MTTRKRKYVPHLGKFYHNPDTWTSTQAERLFRKTKTPFSEPILDSVVYEDCIAGMKKLPDSSVDLVVADPPFGIDFNGLTSAYNRESGHVIQGYEEVLIEDYGSFTMSWMKQVHRLMRDHASAYIFSGYTNLKEVIEVCEILDMPIINHIIWKYNFGLFTRKKFVTSHYHILLAVKDIDKYYFNKVDHYPEDVWDYKRVYCPGVKKNGTKLPVPLVKQCIDFSSKPGSTILDPFMGNGTTAVAAKQNWRHFVGFELNEALREVINTQLELAQEGESYVWFDKRSYIRSLRKKYPRAARVFDRRKQHATV